MDAALSEEAVENLVTQFSSAFDFYRELVQNSIDAGTPSVDVWLEYEAGQDREGVISIHVDDFGEGMNEQIIDAQLTKLFASSKEHDLTKIGKFGIGFVSVFALKPRGVLVRTGRDGEYWEIFFFEDRSFTKTKLAHPVEGTQITLFLTGDRGRYEELVERSHATLKKWCSHSDTEISFEDRSPADEGDFSGPSAINEPFEVSGDCGVEVDYPGTSVALAYSTEPVYGYYNKGLALAVTKSTAEALEERAGRYLHIAVKIKSRYLEHTLSRETVMRDDNYEKAMLLLDEAVDIYLRPRLIDELEALCATEEWSFPEVERYRALMGYLAAEPAGALVSLTERSILRTVDGEAMPMKQADRSMAAHGRVMVAEAPSGLTQLLRADGIPVFRRHGSGGTDDPVQSVVLAYLAARARLGLFGFVRNHLNLGLAENYGSVVHPQTVMVGVTVQDDPPPETRTLLAGASALLAFASLSYRKLLPGTLEGSPESSRLFVLGPKVRDVMQLPPSAIYQRGLLERPAAVVNHHHPYFRWLLEFARSQPSMAAYCLAKSLMLEEDRALDRDIDLMNGVREGVA